MVWLRLFHGRNAVDEQMDDWGFDGPVLGPLTYVHLTYLTSLNVGFATLDAALEFGFPDTETMLEIEEGMVKYDGKWYGDMSVNSGPVEA